MGLKDMSEGGNDFAAFSEGDNAIVQLSQLDVDTGSYQGEEYQQLAMRFDATKDNGTESGVVPGWFSSKITVRDSDEHTSNLAKLLREAGVLRQVLDEVVGDSSAVGDVISGEKRWVADDSSENEELGKAVANALNGVRLRVGTSLNSDESYSVVKDVYGLAEDRDGGESSDSEESDDDDVLFGDEDESAAEEEAA